MAIYSFEISETNKKIQKTAKLDPNIIIRPVTSKECKEA